jgi:hypothetical protein
VLVGLIAVSLVVAAIRDGGGPWALLVAVAVVACVGVLIRRALRAPTRGRNLERVRPRSR